MASNAAVASEGLLYSMKPNLKQGTAWVYYKFLLDQSEYKKNNYYDKNLSKAGLDIKASPVALG